MQRFGSFALTAFCLLSISNLAFPFAGGTGTAEDPYQISTKADLEAVNNDCSVHYKLINDIDLSGYTYDKAVIAYDTDSDSTFDGTGFTGSFAGAGFKITGLTINSTTYYTGLFGFLGSGASITNLAVEDCAVSSSYDYTGGICGINDSGSITNCYSTGSVSTSGSITGGICGINYGPLTNCYSTGSVSGGDFTGGLCGVNGTGTITNCYSTGSVSGGVYTGGLCGINGTGTITNCFWDTQASAMTSSAGGTGLTTAQMQTLSTFTSAGWDFFGETANGTDDIWYMYDNDYPTFSWSVHFFPGGTGTVEDPYQISTKADLDAVNDGSNQSLHYVMINDIDLSGYTYSRAVIAYNTDSGYYFDGVQFTGTFDGAGFKITGLTIDSVASFTGLFGQIGSGASITNLAVEDCAVSSSYDYTGGLCGHNRYGTITNCCSTGDVSGDLYSGGLCGRNSDGAITSCYSAGTVSSSEDNTGGLCGQNYHGTITNCYSTGTVSSSVGSTGGLCGHNWGGTITNCYSTGDVSGDYFTGGLCGINEDGTITNCYSTGNVSGGDYTGGLCGYNGSGTITNCFWDTLASEMTSSAGGTGLTTAEMQQLTTYSQAGWDFDDIWIVLNGGYPQLQVFITTRYELPDVAGMYVPDSRQILSEAGFTDVSVIFMFDDSVAKNHVILQEPDAGSMHIVPEDTPVVVTISMGPDCQTYLPTDYNGDCVVDLTDYSALAGSWLAGM